MVSILTFISAQLEDILITGRKHKKGVTERSNSFYQKKNPFSMLTLRREQGELLKVW